MGLAVAQVARGEPMSLAISWLCWNSAQSILSRARGSPKRASAMTSTTRVLPEPVGPRKSRLPTGRPGGFSPARKVWYMAVTLAMASSWPTTLRCR